MKLLNFLTSLIIECDLLTCVIVGVGGILEFGFFFSTYFKVFKNNFLYTSKSEFSNIMLKNENKKIVNFGRQHLTRVLFGLFGFRSQFCFAFSKAF